MCKVCGWKVNAPIYGERHRNHCNNCLSSIHLDNEPGDREADCGGIMEPVEADSYSFEAYNLYAVSS